MSHPWPAWLVRPRLAVVLGGGATLGALEVGVIDGLIARGILPDMLVGTSAGAINAAYWAFDSSPSTGEKLLRFWLEADQSTMIPDGRLPMFGRLVQGRDHLTTQAGLRRLLLHALPAEARIEESSIPLAIVATNAESGDREVLLSGPLHAAVLASSAIPGLFPAVQLGDRRYVDGGITANCDIEAAIDMGATDVIVVDVMGDGPLTGTFSVASVIERSLGIAMRRQTDLVVQVFRTQARIAVLRPELVARPHAWDFRQTRALYAWGRQAADAFTALHVRPNRSLRPGLFEFRTEAANQAGEPPVLERAGRVAAVGPGR
jgi:NTE family protein